MLLLHWTVIGATERASFRSQIVSTALEAGEPLRETETDFATKETQKVKGLPCCKVLENACCDHFTSIHPPSTADVMQRGRICSPELRGASKRAVFLLCERRQHAEGQHEDGASTCTTRKAAPEGYFGACVGGERALLKNNRTVSLGCGEAQPINSRSIWRGGMAGQRTLVRWATRCDLPLQVLTFVL